MTEERRPDEEQDEALVGSAGEDVSGGISVSGVGGEKVGESGDEEAPIDDIVERASRTAWGRSGRSDDEWGGP